MGNIHSIIEDTCSICTEEYNNTDRRPVGLHNIEEIVKKNHTKIHFVCYSCIFKLTKQECPICRVKIQRPTSYTYEDKQLKLIPKPIPVDFGIDLHSDDQLTTLILRRLYPNLLTTFSMILSNREITYINPTIFQIFQNVRNIYLHNNNIESIHADTFSNLPSLERIELQYCNIQSIMPCVFYKIPNLKQLILHNNNIRILKTATFIGLHLLEHIELHNCGICEIMKHTFYNLPNLRQIIFNGNNIRTLDKDTFFDLPKLPIYLMTL
jgi:Leucine-rich repeat (LRR) protein